MILEVRWEVTEVHSARIEVSDDFDMDEFEIDSLAEYEEGSSFEACTDRTVLDYRIILPTPPDVIALNPRSNPQEPQC